MNSVLLRGGRLIDPGTGRDEIGDLRIQNGTIEACGGRLAPAAGEKVIDATGHLVTPGLVDLCVHLREPGFESHETIRSGARAALAGGFTSVAAMPDTDPPIDTEASVALVRLKGEAARAARVYPVGALTRHREGQLIAEMGGMARAGAIAFSDETSGVDRTEVFLRALRYARMVGRPVLSRCEDAGLRGQGVASPGLIADLLALPAIAPGTEEIMLGRNLHLARQERASLHVLHLSSAESMRQLAAAKAAGVAVTASVTPMHLLLTEEAIQDYQAIYKVRPPLRRDEDRAALVAALAEGTVDAISSDHSPVGEEEKDIEFIYAAAGTGGLETTFSVLFTELVEGGRLSALRLVEALSTAPARILGVPGGTLGVGEPGDVAVFDVQERHPIDPAKFLSRSRMSPFAGRAVTGRARHALVQGELRYHDFRIVS